MKNKTLDLIIPAYNSFELLPRALGSVALQEIDFNLNVIIVNDHSKRSYEKEINLFKDRLNITEIYLSKNCGVGVSRQIGLDNSKGDYIVFLDCDDLFYDETSLQQLYDMMNFGYYEYAYGAIIIEENAKQTKYNNHDGCLHGKIFNKKLLNKYNINFNTTRTSEDNSFNHICLFNATRINKTTNPIYIYKDNNNSLTKGLDMDEIASNLIDYINNIEYTLNHVKNKFRSDVVLYYIQSCYYIWNNYTYYSKKYKKQAELILNKLIELINNTSYYKDDLIDKLYPQMSFSVFKNLINLKQV